MFNSIFEIKILSMFSLFDFSLWLNGFPIQKAKNDIEKIVALSAQEGDCKISFKKQYFI